MLGGKGPGAHSEGLVPKPRPSPLPAWPCPERLQLQSPHSPHLLPGATLSLPGPSGPPPPGHPAAPTWNVCHTDLELPVEKRVPRLKACATPAGTGTQGVSCSVGSLSKPRRVWAGPPCRRGERAAPGRFLPKRGRTVRPRRPDPRWGQIMERLWEHLKGLGLLRGPSPSAGGQAPAFPALGVCYNGSLLCLGHFKEKLSSVNTQPASLAHG